MRRASALATAAAPASRLAPAGDSAMQHMVDQAMGRKGDTLLLPFNDPNLRRNFLSDLGAAFRR